MPSFPWREYLATHPMAAELVGPGVTSFVFQEIADTRDPNRGGLPRVDFLVHRADGSAYRLHPGKTRRQDAKPHYLPPTSFAGESTATEHTRTTSSSASAFSWSEARLIPQSDRIGRGQRLPAPARTSRRKPTLLHCLSWLPRPERWRDVPLEALVCQPWSLHQCHSGQWHSPCPVELG